MLHAGDKDIRRVLKKWRGFTVLILLIKTLFIQHPGLGLPYANPKLSSWEW